MISETMQYKKKFASVAGKQIAYVEEGSGDPIVLLHGNPTSSFLWRNIIPELADSGRVIVPDLIGQGDSEKLSVAEGPDRYSLEVAYSYVISKSSRANSLHGIFNGIANQRRAEPHYIGGASIEVQTDNGKRR